MNTDKKRTIILTLEYTLSNYEPLDYRGEYLHAVINNLRRILNEDMPYLKIVKIVNIKDEPKEE